jgi:hypothetical protein
MQGFGEVTGGPATGHFPNFSLPFTLTRQDFLEVRKPWACPAHWGGEKEDFGMMRVAFAHPHHPNSRL